MILSYLRSFFKASTLEDEFHLDSKATDMNVIECEKCNGWVPEERFPYFKRKKRKVRGRLCRDCIDHQRKCRLTRSLYFTRGNRLLEK